MSEKQPFDPFTERNRGWRLKLLLWCRTVAKGRHQHLLFVLASFANEHGDCYPAVKTIAANMEIDPRSVRRMLAELKAAGTITVRPSYENGWQTTNIYTLDYHWLPEEGMTPMSGGDDSHVRGTPDSHVIQRQSKISIEERKKEEGSLSGGSIAADGSQNQAFPSGGPLNGHASLGSTKESALAADDLSWLAFGPGSVHGNGKM